MYGYKGAVSLRLYYILQCLCIVLLLSACSTKLVLREDVQIIGIAPCSQPKELYQLFAGKLFSYRTYATAQDEYDLTQLLAKNIDEHTLYTSYILDISSEQSANMPPLEYWSALGEKQGVDIIIVPYIMEWREESYARNEYIPPKVVIDYYLIDTKKKILLERSRYFDEYMKTEYDLRYNTPPNGMFFSHRPTRRALALDSIYKMLIDFTFVKNKKEKNIFAD